MSTNDGVEVSIGVTDNISDQEGPHDAELLSIIESAQHDPEGLDKLQEFYQNNVEHKFAVHISSSVSSKLCKVLMLKSAEKTDSQVRPEVTPTAKKSLELFFGFLQHVSSFQDTVETYEGVDLGQRLKLERHLLANDDEHRLIAAELIAFLSSNFPKFSDWKVYVNKDAHSAVEKHLGQLPSSSFEIAVPRLSQSSHLPPEGEYYDTEIDQLVEIFHTNKDSGLTSIDAANRQTKYGKNVLPRAKPPTILAMLKNQLFDFLVMILLLAAVISAAMNDFIATAALIAVVAVNVLIGFSQEYKAERALAALQSLTVPQAFVYRDGERISINSEELVPGDIVELVEGDMIAADIRIFEVSSLQVIEAILTGESLPIEKKTEAIAERSLAIGDRKNMAFMSTVVSKGKGKGIVVSTGKDTEVGKISKALATAGDKRTPLQKKISRLGKILVFIAVFLCIIIFVVGMARGKEHWLELVKVAVSLAVSVIPEGLVAVVTITFALGVGRMKKRNALVRRLPAVETLGSVTTICSDKTGTLTEGKMNCKNIWCGEQAYTLTGVGFDPSGEINDESGAAVSVSNMSKALEKLCMVCSVCNNSQVIAPGEKNVEWAASGNPTEASMLVAATKGGLSKDVWLNERGFTYIAECPFDSGRKRMSVAYRDDTGAIVVMVKGAPERVLKICTHYYEEGTGPVPIQESQIENIDKISSEMASQGLRVLATAYRSGEESEEFSSPEAIEKDLCFIGLVGIIDPPRASVKQSIKTCNTAGITVIMITGDHPTTASAIAEQLGIIKEGDLGKEGIVMTGKELDTLSNDELVAADPFPCVFARVSPDNKLQIVNALKARGEIVAMTGDGVNDAPAIKHSNIGVAMGLAGTDLTKQSADMILLDDNFSTIVAAVEEGRRTYDNILKFVMYLLSANSAEIFVMMFSVAVGFPIPFTAVMILWANLFADIPPALALGVDPKEPDVLDRKPRDPKSGIFSVFTSSIVLFQGLNMSLISLIIYVIALWVEKYEVPHARSLVYAGLTTIQLFHALLSRSVKNSVFSKECIANKWLLFGIVVSLFFLVFGLYTPIVNTILELHPLGWFDWIKIFIGLIAHVLVIEFVKLLLRINAKYSTSTSKFYEDI